MMIPPRTLSKPCCRCLEARTAWPPTPIFSPSKRFSPTCAAPEVTSCGPAKTSKHCSASGPSSRVAVHERGKCGRAEGRPEKSRSSSRRRSRTSSSSRWRRTGTRATSTLCKVIFYLCAGRLPRSDTRSCKSAVDGTRKRRSRSSAEARWLAPNSRVARSRLAPTSSSSNIV